MTFSHRVEALFVRGLRALVRSMSWRASLRLGAGVGALAYALGIRRAVGAANLAVAFPERTPAERERILRAHYRHLGQVACEYARLAELARSQPGEVVAVVRGYEHLEAAARAGRGVIILTGHYGTLELMGAWMGRSHPTDFVLKPLSNPAVDAIHTGLVAEAGITIIPLGVGARRIFTALRQGRWVAVVADQDARAAGTFVPFFGRLSSTPIGPAVIAHRTRAPVVMIFITRRDDGRHEIDITPQFPPPAGDSPENVRDFTALHTARLEEWVRRHPEMWLWLHKRWKTAPPEERASGDAGSGDVTASTIPDEARAG
jgi:Kdo2-lipid IVA lauroyltransferase/acyltransferase